MICKKLSIIVLSFFIMLTPTYYAHPADSTQEQLEQYISELQKSPHNTQLREKIIRHAQTMKPVPAAPEGVRKYMVRGRAAFQEAKEKSDFQEAINEFRKAALVAPWVGEVYYNLGTVEEKAGQLASAMESFKLYLLASPKAPDAAKVRDLIYELEYRQEKAEKKAAEAARSQAAEQRNRDEERRAKMRTLQSWSGIWGDRSVNWRVTIQGNSIDIVYYENYNWKYRKWHSNHPCPWSWRGTILDNFDLSLTVSRPDSCTYTPRPPTMSWPVTGRISLDEQKIYIKGRDWNFNTGVWYEGNTELIRVQ